MAEKDITTIVFTKNRPLQLHGYLESIHRFLPVDKMKVYLLYKPELFEDEYEMCFASFPNCFVVRETDFFGDMMHLIEQTDTEYMLFGIDDVVYYDGVSWSVVEKTFKMLSPNIVGFSLRHGDTLLKRCGDPVEEYVVLGECVKTFVWPQGRTPWTTYPFDLCATIYRTETIQRIVYAITQRMPMVRRIIPPDTAFFKIFATLYSRRKLLKLLGHFFNPNTFESWACRWCKQHPDEVGPLLAFQKSCATAIQVNLVNTSTRNEWDDCAELTVEALAEKYRAGWRMDIEAIARQRPTQTHSGREFFHLKGPEGNHVHI